MKDLEIRESKVKDNSGQTKYTKIMQILAFYKGVTPCTHTCSAFFHIQITMLLHFIISIRIQKQAYLLLFNLLHTNHPKYLKHQFIKLHYVEVGKVLLKYKYVPLEVLIEKLKTEMNYSNIQVPLVILFRQTENVLKDSTAFVNVTKSEKSSH